MKRRSVLVALTAPLILSLTGSPGFGLTRIAEAAPDLRSRLRPGALTPDGTLFAPLLEASRQPSLADLVSATVGGQSGAYGIAIRNLKTGETFTANPDQFFPAASLYKLAVLYEVFRQQTNGTLALNEVLTVLPDDTDEETDDDPLRQGDQVLIQQALAAMIQVSSNDAAHVLARRVGWEQVNQTMAAVGLNHTRLPVGSWQAQVSDWRHDMSCTSPSDLLTFFDHLYRRQLISPPASDQMQQILLGQQINDRLPAALPKGTPVAHKTGNYGSVVNDAGIIYGPRAHFIVVVLGNDVDESAATSTEAQLARNFYQRFNGG